MVPLNRKLGIRWTIGDVSAPGFEALRLAVWGVYRLFREAADYTICVNTIPAAEALARTGPLPTCVGWHESKGLFPEWLLPHLDPDSMIEGKAWKFDPVRLYPDRWELSFDNDCILWELPPSIQEWLLEGRPDRCLIAADVALAHGAFADRAGGEPRNSGIRGTPPGFDFEGELMQVLLESGVRLRSELDEQGLQVAAASRRCPPIVTSVAEVSITSPFQPHLPGLGRHGAHFVGLNEQALPWEYLGRPGVHWLEEHWHGHRPELYRRVGIEPLVAGPLPDAPDVA